MAHTPRTAAILLGLLMPSALQAQTFLQEKDQGRVIANTIYSHSDKGFDDNANVQDIANYDQVSVYLLTEYGLTDDVTLLLTPSFRSVNVKGGDDSTGLGYTDVGARVRLAEGSNYVISAQGLVRIPGVKRRDNQAQVGNTDTEYDLRLAGARTFQIGGSPAFFSLEGAYRLREGQPPNEYHVDATFGVNATPRLLLLASSFNTISDGRGSGVFRQKFRYNQAYLSGVYDVTPSIALQLGVQGTVAGRNALRERGVFGGVWFRF